jgi:uncharacterized membrane protein
VRFLAASSLIGPDDTWALWSVVLGWVAMSIVLERRYRVAAQVSGPVIAILGGIGLANAGVVPAQSGVYDVVWSHVVPVAIPLLLFRANVRRIWKEAGRTFGAFHVSALGTVAGGLIAGALLSSRLEHAAEITGIMTGSYLGGSVNFISLTSVFRPPEEIVNAAVVADNLVMTLFFFVLLALPSVRLVRRFFATPHEDAARKSALAFDGTPSPPAAAPARPIALADIAVALALAVIVAAAATKAAAILGAESMPALVRLLLGQRYLVLTLLAVLLATFFPRAVGERAGSEEMGTFLIYLFFFVIGVPADVATVLTKAPLLLLLCAVMVLVNLAVTLGLGRLLRFDLEELLVASNANVGGPMTAAAMATAKGWSALVLPAMLVGIWGYVIGTWVGQFVGKGLQAALGGG